MGDADPDRRPGRGRSRRRRLSGPALLAAAALAWTAVPTWTAGADDGAGCRSLHEAAFLDEPDEVAALLAAHVDVNCRDDIGQTPLITAAAGGSLESVRRLLAAGAETAASDPMGWSATAHARDALSRLTMAGADRYRRIYGDIIRLIEAAGGGARE